MSDRTPPGEPEPGSTPPPAPSWGAPPPEEPHGPTDPQVPYPPQPGRDQGRRQGAGQGWGQGWGHGGQPGQQRPGPGDQHGPPGAGYPAYPQQGPYGGGFPAGPVTNQKAQWALTLGLLAVPLACCSVLLGLVGVVAIVLGVQARREIAASGGQQTGEGLATTGMVAGALATLIVVLLGLLLMVLVIGGELLVTTS